MSSNYGLPTYIKILRKSNDRRNNYTILSSLRVRQLKHCTIGMAVFDCVTQLVLLRDTHTQAVLFVPVFAQARQPDVDVSCSLNHDGKGTEA